MKYKIGQFVRRDHISDGFFVIGKIEGFREDIIIIKKYFQHNPHYKLKDKVYEEPYTSKFEINVTYKNGKTTILKGVNDTNIKQQLFLEIL